jgi:hypothetical protein
MQKKVNVFYVLLHNRAGGCHGEKVFENHISLDKKHRRRRTGE